jgi:hypothetical protein
MMTTAKFILTAFVIVVATLWGTAQQANAIVGTSPGSGSRGDFRRTPTGEYGHGHHHRTTTHYPKHKHQH